MSKKLIAVAVSGLFAAPMLASAADDSVQLYGRLQAEYSSTKIDQTGTNGYRQNVIGDNAGQSRWGLDIKEDLGNGLTARGRIEFGFNTGNGAVENAREQWVGIGSKTWGAFQFGRVVSPVKNFAGGYSIEIFSDTNLQGAGAGGAMYAPANGLGVGGFVDHALRYDSPEFNGFSAALLYIPSNATQADPAVGVATNAAGTAVTSVGSGTGVGGKGGANDYQVAAKYKFGTLGQVFAAYSRNNASDAEKLLPKVNGRTADDERLWRIGGSVTFADFTFAGQYDDIKHASLFNGGATCGGGGRGAGNDTGVTTAQCNSALNANGDGNIWFLTAQYKIGNTTLVVQGGRTKADSVYDETTGALTATERKAKNITVGAVYRFSKRTSIFGGYQKVSIDGARTTDQIAQNNLAAVTGTTVLAVQPDRSTWEIGMRHDF